MNEALTLAAACAAGAALGILFFGGLWWTVHRGMASQAPALVFLGSMVLRTSATLAGFYFVADGEWQRLLLCLLGFVAARFMVTMATRSPRARKTRLVEESAHAPQP